MAKTLDAIIEKAEPYYEYMSGVMGRTMIRNGINPFDVYQNIKKAESIGKKALGSYADISQVFIDAAKPFVFYNPLLGLGLAAVQQNIDYMKVKAIEYEAPELPITSD